MKTIAEILNELKEKYTFYKKCRDFWKEQANKEEELYHLKAQKQSEDLAREYQVKMNLIVDIYESISGLDLDDVVHILLHEESK